MKFSIVKGYIQRKVFLAAIFLGIAVFSTIVYAEQTTPTPTPTPNTSSQQDKLKELNKQIAETEAKIKDLQGQEKTLSSQIGVLDNQIKLTELRIDATRQEITDLTLDIDTASKKIDNLDGALDELTQVLVNRIVATYAVGKVQPFQVLLASDNVDNFFSRLNYLKIAQEHDRELIFNTFQAKNDYENQKNILEEKKQKVESLREELEGYTAQLDKDKETKSELLAATQNDEQKFQREVARLKADRDAILSAISNVGAKIGDVNKGDVIATQGNTGCVYPPPPGGHHLHFEVYKDAKVSGNAVVDVNSGEYIQFKFSNHLVNPHQYLDGGGWAKPISIYPNNITTEFGQSSFLGPHTGLDIAGPVGSAIFAVEKGVAYAVGGSTCDAQMGYPSGTTTAARGRVVDHQNGIVTLYWHTSN